MSEDHTPVEPLGYVDGKPVFPGDELEQLTRKGWVRHNAQESWRGLNIDWLNDFRWSKKEQGLIDKFQVIRRDGKHPNARYLVLDLDHDPFARRAAEVYAEAAKEGGYQKLGLDIGCYLMQTQTAHALYMINKEEEEKK